MSADLPAGGLTGTIANALCPHPNLLLLLLLQKRHICNPFHILSSETRGNRVITRAKQKLISSVSPSPLTAGVAQAVTGNLADKREAQLQNQIRGRMNYKAEK